MAPKYIAANEFFRIINGHTPASSSETNHIGSITYDEGYMYVWTATNVNKRATLNTW